jgi:hypothetical protein
MRSGKIVVDPGFVVDWGYWNPPNQTAKPESTARTRRVVCTGPVISGSIGM